MSEGDPAVGQPADCAPLLCVVEDDEAIRKLLVQSLEDDGYRVVSADDGETALGLVATDAPRLILLDVRLPKMDGFEFIRLYHETCADPATILLLSASPPPEALPKGTVQYVRKPFDLDELMALITELVGQGDQSRRTYSAV